MRFSRRSLAYLFLFLPSLLSLSACYGQSSDNNVAGWWYNEQPEGFEDQSIGGGGRPRQVPSSSNTGANAGKR